jgi:chemotaxis signal transduction protein
MMILFCVAGVKFAIAANAVDEIRDLDGLKTFSGITHPRLTKVKYTLERQNRVYFVVDAGAHFRLHEHRPARLLVLRSAKAAVMVDEIEHMHEVQTVLPLPRAFSGEERDWYRGLTVIEGRVVPVLRAETFLTRAEATLLRASFQNGKAPARTSEGVGAPA